MDDFLDLFEDEDLAILGSCMLGALSILGSVQPTMAFAVVPDVLFTSTYINKKDITVKDIGVCAIDDHLTYGVTV